MSFPLTLAFVFLVFWRPQEWLLPWLYGWPLLDAIVYASLLALAMEINQGQVRLRRNPAFWLTTGLWISTILSHMAHTYFQGIVDTLPHSFKFCFFLFLMLAAVDRVERLRAIIWVIVATSVIISVHCLMQQRLGHGFAGQPPLPNFRPLQGIWVIRSQFFGIFNDPNDTAQLLAAAIPLVYACPRRLNLFNVLACTAVAWLIFAAHQTTHSRGGDIALIATLAAMLMIKLPVRWLPYAAVVGLLGGLVLCGLRGGGMLDASAQERVVFWGMANWQFKANPIFGIGYGMFWQIASDRAVHNAFVTCYTEIGLVGYWFWFSLLQLGVIGCWRTRMALQRPKTGAQAYVRRLAGLSIACIVGFAAGGYFLSRAFIFPFFFLFGVLNAIPAITKDMLPENHPPLINQARDIFGWGTLTTLFSVAYIYVTILILNKAFYG